MSSLGSPSSSPTQTFSSPWQDKLLDHCQKSGLGTPVFRIFSDRRGCRTAWSASADLPGRICALARYWYDGDHINNAKEDAAEVALQQLRVVESPKSTRAQTYPTPRNFYRPN